MRCGRTGGAFPEGWNPLQMHSPCHVSVKHAFLATHLRLSMPFREMLLTRHSVVPGWFPTTHRVPGIPGGTTGPTGPFVHSIGQFSRRTHGVHYRKISIVRNIECSQFFKEEDSDEEGEAFGEMHPAVYDGTARREYARSLASRP